MREVSSPERVPRAVENAVAHWFEDPSSLARVAAENGVELGLWTADGQLIAGSAFPPNPAWGPAGWRWFREGPGVEIQLDDGTIGVAALVDSAWAPSRRRHLVLLTLTLAVLGLGTWPLARRLTRRLEGLRRTMSKWEGGDLGARARVDGRDEVADLARQFNSAAERVQNLVLTQRRLLASASHEFRSPLTRIRMAVALMDDGTARGAELVADIEELDALVGDLLAAGRGNARAISPSEVDLDALAKEEADRVGASVAGNSGPVWVDAPLVRRLVRNLLQNAVRHGAVPIALSLERTTTGVMVTVTDGGPGIAEGDRERVFEPFWRPSGHREDQGSVGLGLALVREVARAHGGDATVLVGAPSRVRATLQTGPPKRESDDPVTPPGCSRR